MTNMLVYTSDNKYMVLDIDGKLEPNTLDEIQDDLANVYPKQIYDVPYYDYYEPKLNYMNHLILDINNCIHIVSIVDDGPKLCKHFYNLETEHGAILRVCYDTRYSERNHKKNTMCITWMRICGEIMVCKMDIVMTNTLCCAKVDTLIQTTGTFCGLFNGNIIMEENGANYIIHHSGQTIKIPIDGDSIKYRKNFDGIEYIHNNILHINTRTEEVDINLSLDMTKHKIISYYYRRAEIGWACIDATEVHVLLLVDENNDAYVYELMYDDIPNDISKFQRVGQIVGDYSVVLRDSHAVVIQPHNIRNISIYAEIGQLEDIEYKINSEIACVDGCTFKEYSWTKQTHKYLSPKNKSIVKTFVMCNKIMGQFRVPYYLLCKMFTYMVISKSKVVCVHKLDFSDFDFDD